MDYFAGIKVMEELNGPNIYRLENIMTLDTGVRVLFNNLDIWLEETVCFVIRMLGLEITDLRQLTRIHRIAIVFVAKVGTR